MNKTRILSVDGGGIKGILTVQDLLDNLKDLLQKLKIILIQEFMTILTYFQVLVQAL